MTTNNAWNSELPAQEEVGGTSQDSYAQGDILYASAANTLSKLPIGADGTVLRMSSGIPQWGPGGLASLIFIDSFEADNDDELDVTSVISSTYKNYWIFITQMKPDDTGNTIRMRVSTDNGSSFEDGGSDYSYYMRSRRTGDADLDTNFDGADSKIEISMDGEVRALAGAGANYWIKVYDPYNTASKTRFEVIGNYLHQPTGLSCHLWGSGMYNTAARTNAFRFYFEDGDIDEAWISVYGMLS